VIVSDATRSEPRAEILAALQRHLPAVRWTFAIATGTHGPSPLGPLGLPEDLGATVINHDGHRERDLVDLGTTRRGTPVRLHRCVVDADLVIATGTIRPHYFAGFGAGVKAIFPGLGSAGAIRTNHLLKTEPGARAGIVVGNPCREDLEEAVSFLPTPTFLFDGVSGPDDAIHAAVAGDPVLAFRAGVDIARPWFTARARAAPIVIASDALPVTATLYQAAKIAAACADLVEPSGVLVLVAECPDGTGPLPVTNEAVFRIGVLPRLAPGVTIRLVSALSPSKVACTLVEHAESVEAVLAERAGRVLVIPRASQLLLEQSS
jgi:nickel-dependent lactate racemase